MTLNILENAPRLEASPGLMKMQILGDILQILFIHPVFFFAGRVVHAGSTLGTEAEAMNKTVPALAERPFW